MAKHFFNGSIYTDPNNKTSDLYVSDIGTVCSREEYEQQSTKETINLEGKCLVPSFRDGHLHPLLGGRESLGLDVSKAKTVAELGGMLHDHLSAHPDLLWLDAGTYNRGIQGAQVSRSLDEYVSSIPVVLHADDHHTIWVNSKALEIAGLNTLSVPKLAVTGIDLGEKGQPTGILREARAKDLVLKHAPKRILEEERRALLKAETLLLAAGITEVQDAWVDEEILAVYKHSANHLKLTYHLAFALDPDTLEMDFEFVKQAKDSLQGSTLNAHAVKIFIDGVFGSATAKVSKPYLSTKATGELDWEASALAQALDFAQTNQLQAHLHAIGDAGIAFALDAIEQSGTLNAVIAHAELTNETLISRAKSLGVTLCVQPYWAQRNDLLLTCEHHLGQVRLESLYAFRSFLDAGIQLAFSSDWPVSSYEPLEGMATSVFRRLKTDQIPHNESESISIQDALAAYTTGVTSMLGSAPANLHLGSMFDAVLLKEDLMQQDLEGFKSLEVLAVYKSGTRLFPHHQD